MHASSAARSPLRAPSSICLPSVETRENPYELPTPFMRCPSWRSCSKSAAASAARSVSTSLWRLRMKVGIRSSRSFATVTLWMSSAMTRRIIGAGRFAPRAPRQTLSDCSMEVPGMRLEPAEQRAVVAKAPRDEVHHLAVALDHALHPQQAGAEQLLPLA